MDKNNHSRPISPHLQIYKPQISSVLSALHRIFGICLIGGFTLLVAWLFYVAVAHTNFIFVSVLIFNISKALFFIFSSIFFYYFLNGIRHLVWDFGFGLSKKSSTWSGILVLVLTISLSAFMAFLLYFA